MGKPGRLVRSTTAQGDGRQARQLENVPIEQLSGDSDNPRKHDRSQIQAIARSIESFGFNAPILIDKRNRVIAGHARLDAARMSGLKHVPAVRLEHLGEVEARAYMIADNKLGERSSWDEAVLAQHLKELSELALDFEIEATGFELPEIDILIQSLDPCETPDKLDDFAEAQGPLVTAPGDLWILGRHRVLCGSALDPQSYSQLLGDEKAACVFTDPPYNVAIDGHAGGKGAVRHSEFVMASGEMTKKEFSDFLSTCFQNTVEYLGPGGLFYACMDWRHIDEMSAAGRQAKLDFLNLCVWVKNNGGMGAFYRSQHELIFVFRNGPSKHLNNVQLGRFGRNRSNVWHYAGANSFPRRGQQRGIAFHPTSKPIALVADAILDATKPDDIVLDPFLGAGTSILAAERTGRRAYGVEIDPRYVDTAIGRWQAMTGQVATHSSGSSFADVRVQRAGAP